MKIELPKECERRAVPQITDEAWRKHWNQPKATETKERKRTEN
jgi:hypothetical protein